jgi:hypothetical protein
MAQTLDLHPLQAPVPLSTPKGFRVVSTSIGPAGEAIRLLVPEMTARLVFATEEQAGWASFPKTHTQEPYSAKAQIVSASGSSEREVPVLTATYPLVQTLPGGAILVVSSRCQRMQDGTVELNAKIFTREGFLEAEFCLGDGIEHVQSDSMGRIWVGYFDEGVYGNFGWGRDATPLGAAGLVCFDREGKKLWDFEPPEGFDSISDCYGLNVAEENVWACYYTDFPIVRIGSRGRVEGWSTNLSGPRQFAVSDHSVLVYGGYGDQKDECKLLRLGNGRADHVMEVKLMLPDGVDLGQCKVLGRDRVLHVFSSAHWYTFGCE